MNANELPLVVLGLGDFRRAVYSEELRQEASAVWRPRLVTDDRPGRPCKFTAVLVGALLIICLYLVGCHV